MFLIAITKSKLNKGFGLQKSYKFKKGEFNVTVLTDDFLSYFLQDKKSFSNIESPRIAGKKANNLIFSELRYDENINLIQINQSTISGRPIYYHVNSKGEFFCSSHIVLLRKAGVKIKENKEVLPEFFVYRYVMPPRTLYKDIYKILNGNSIKVKLAKGKWKVVSTEKIKIRIPKNHVKDAPTKIFKKTCFLLDESIKKLNYPQKNISLLLSGGLDSSILCKLLQTNHGIKITYSGGYPFENHAQNVEKEYALSAANALGTQHEYYEPIAKDYLSGLIEAIYRAEEPLHHLQSVIFYLLFKNKIRKEHDVLVCGFGADGIFGSELHQEIFRSDKIQWEILSHQPFIAMLDFISRVSSRGKHFVQFLKTKAERNVPLNNQKNTVWLSGRYGSEEWVCKHFKVNGQDIIKGRYNYFKSFESNSTYDILSIINFSGSTSVSESILSKLAESNGKIIYYPFNSQSVLDYAFALDWKIKLKKSKNVLRNVARILKIPEFIITRKKSGFGLSYSSWAQKDGAFEPLVPLILKMFDEAEIRMMQSQDPKKAMIYWSMINYGIWKRLFINNEPMNKLLNELNYELNRKKRG